MPAAALPSRPRSLAKFGLRLRPPGGGNPARSDQMRSIAVASVTVALKSSRLDLLSATAAAGPATKTRMGKAEASEPRMQEARVTKAEVSEAWTEKATAEPAVPTSAKSDGNSDRPSPAPWVTPTPVP